MGNEPGALARQPSTVSTGPLGLLCTSGAYRWGHRHGTLKMSRAGFEPRELGHRSGSIAAVLGMELGGRLDFEVAHAFVAVSNVFFGLAGPPPPHSRVFTNKRGERELKGLGRKAKDIKPINYYRPRPL